MNFAYLASPYTDRDPAIQNDRAELAAVYAARLMVANQFIYSPIVQGHALAPHLPPELTAQHKFWMVHCFPLFSSADRLFVLPLDGWRQSKGVQIELNWAKVQGKPIYFIQDLVTPYMLHLELIEEEELTENGWKAIFFPDPALQRHEHAG